MEVPSYLMILHFGSIVLFFKLSAKCLPFHLSASEFHSVRKRDVWAKLQAVKLKQRKIILLLLLFRFHVT